MTLAHHQVLRRERRRLRTATAAAVPAVVAVVAAWAWLHRPTPGSWMRMPVEGVISGTGRVSFPGIPDGGQGNSPPQAAGQPSRVADGADAVAGLAPSTAPATGGAGTLVPFPAQVGIDLAALGPRFGVGMHDPPYRWWVVGKAPPGFGEPAFDAATGSWSFKGAPEREGVYRLSLAWARNGDRPVVLSTNVVVSAAAGGAPLAAVVQADAKAFVGQPLGEQVALHGYLLPLGGECATWAVEAGSLPAGASLVQGCLVPGSAVIDPASVPSEQGRSTFTLVATAPDGTVASTDEVALSVGEPSLSVALERHGPPTADGRPVSYDAVTSYGNEEFPAPGYASGASGGDSVSYELEGDLPAGLSFSARAGTVSGVARKGASGTFRLRATMSRPDGSRETVYGQAVSYGASVQAAD